MNSTFPNAIARLQKLASDAAACWVGHHITLAVMALVVVGWTSYGAFAGFTKEWFLISNMFATVVAFLILLLVQHTRARRTQAIQAKLDELIFSSAARNHWIGAERHAPELIQEMRVRHHFGN
jgi:low affinity Fe/Cu permease